MNPASKKPSESQQDISNQTILLFILGSVTYLLVYWRRLLLESMIPFDGNMIRLFFPSWVVGKKMLIEGFHFLWDPYRNMGQPFLADPQYQALYPIRFLSIFLNFLDYQRIFIIFHTLLASVSGYLLTKKILKEDSAALLAGLVMGFNGFFLAHVTLPAHFATMAWVPVTLLLLNLKKPIPLGVALALQWMAGFPPFFLLTLVVLLFFSFSSGDGKDKRNSLECLIKGIILMLGLAAIQWMPFIEMLKEASRPVFLPGNAAIEYSLHPLELLRQIFVPSFILTSLKPITTSDQAIVSFYIGPAFFLLFLWGVIRGGKREKVYLIMAAVGFVMALGSYNGFYQRIPFVTLFRFPAHWIILPTTAFAFVGAFGLTCFSNRKVRWIIVGLIAFDFLIYSFPMHTAWGDLEFLSKTPFHLKKLDNIPDQSRIFHTSAIVERVHLWKINSKEDWFLIKGISTPSISVAEGVKEAASYNVLTSQRHVVFLNRLYTSPISSPLFDFAGISKIINLTKEGVLKSIPDWKDFEVFENPDFKQIAFMEPNAPIQILKNQPGRIEIQSAEKGRLVLSETYYPGWRAQVDGKRVPLLEFESEFPSVNLDGGSHVVIFRYLPRSFLAGVTTSILTLLSLTFYLIKKRNAHGHENTPGQSDNNGSL